MIDRKQLVGEWERGQFGLRIYDDRGREQTREMFSRDESETNT